jgi:hypothetical protein
MQSHERSKIIMPLNLQERHQFLSIPTGWSVPKFSLGQIVRWEVPGYPLELTTAWGQIIGLSFWEDSWLYEVLPSCDCPLAVTYPATWGTGEDIEMLRAEQLTLMAG